MAIRVLLYMANRWIMVALWWKWKSRAMMTGDEFEEWYEPLVERAQCGDASAVLNEINESTPDELEEQDLGRVRGLAICCLEWCEMDPLAKGLAEELCANSPIIAVSAGIECSDLGEFEYAEEILRTMCERWPDSVYPPLNLGVVLQKLGEHEQAIEYFNRALRIEEGCSHALLERARSYRELDELDEASRAYRQYLDAEPEDTWEWVSLGIVESEREEFGSALEAYDRARRIDPACISAHYNFGVTASRMGDTDLLEGAVAVLRDQAPDDCRYSLLAAYQIEDDSPEKAWDYAIEAIAAAEEVLDLELFEHSVEVALNIGLRNDMKERCAVYIDNAFTSGEVVPAVLDAERRLRGPRADEASQWTVRLEVEVTHPDAIAALTGGEAYDGPGLGYIRVYRVWATSSGEAEEVATDCERRTGYGRVVGVVEIEHHDGLFEEPVGVEWRSEMFGFELERGD